MALAFDHFTGRLGDADFAAALKHPEPDLGRLLALGVDQFEVGHVDRRFAIDQSSGLAHAGRLGVRPSHGGALHDRPFGNGKHPQHFAARALALAGRHQDGVALADTRSHYITSGAREMIFMNLRPRSSRTTGPKMRVPIGSCCLLISTAALRSNRMALPSARRTGNDVRTITAWCTSPFFTLPRGMASFTDTTITSPTEANLRLDPPSTLMHWTRRAPELSATSRLLSTMIMSRFPYIVGAAAGGAGCDSTMAAASGSAPP